MVEPVLREDKYRGIGIGTGGYASGWVEYFCGQYQWDWFSGESVLGDGGIKKICMGRSISIEGWVLWRYVSGRRCLLSAEVLPESIAAPRQSLVLEEVLVGVHHAIRGTFSTHWTVGHIKKIQMDKKPSGSYVA